jgi:endonuclease/exonuclease/phosphatase family metal-dependent hydrolase
MVLREMVDARLQADPKANVVVVGDFNDTRDSRPVRALIGKGKGRLLDARPAEGGSGRVEALGNNSRAITWTHYYEAEDSYSRLDYVLFSPGMAREYVKQESFVLNRPGWGMASDHRPVVVAVEPADN